MHLVKEIIDIKPYSIRLRFNTDEELIIDLEEKLREWSSKPSSKFRELLDPDFFLQVELNNEMKTIYWKNGLDLCPDFLYSIGRRGEQDARGQQLPLER